MTTDEAYLAHVPAEVRALSARINDAELLKAWLAIDAAHTERPTKPVRIPGVGTVAPADLHTVWCWLVDVVKSRHAYEWTAIHDAQLRTVEDAAARAQGVPVGAIDWDAFPDDDPAWNNVESAIDCAVHTLTGHALTEAHA